MKVYVADGRGAAGAGAISVYGAQVEEQNKIIEQFKNKLKELANAPGFGGGGGIDDGLDPAAFQKAQEEASDLSKQIEDLTERLQVQAATFGQSAFAAEIYALKLKGASDQQLASAQAAAEQLDMLNRLAKGPQFAPAAEHGSRAAYSIVAGYQAPVPKPVEANPPNFKIDFPRPGGSSGDQTTAINRVGNTLERIETILNSIDIGGV